MSEVRSILVQLAQWTAGIVVLTLLINAPLMPALLRWTGLADVSPVKARMRAKAERALLRYTETAIHDLQADEDEMLRGKSVAAVFKVLASFDMFDLTAIRLTKVLPHCWRNMTTGNAGYAMSYLCNPCLCCGSRLHLCPYLYSP